MKPNAKKTKATPSVQTNQSNTTEVECRFPVVFLHVAVCTRLLHTATWYSYHVAVCNKLNCLWITCCKVRFLLKDFLTDICCTGNKFKGRTKKTLKELLDVNTTKTYMLVYLH